MTFSGKRYKRTRHENFEELFNDTFGDAMRFLQQSTPIFCFTKIAENTFNYSLEAGNKHITFNFTLGVEEEVQRRDGEKVKMTFTMPSENVLLQVIKIRDGKVVNFRREFYNKEAKMIVTIEGCNDKQATIYFEAVE